MSGVSCRCSRERLSMHAQMVFRLKMKLRSQVRRHVPACGGYHPMPDPAPLDAKLLTLLLPSPIALEVPPGRPSLQPFKPPHCF